MDINSKSYHLTAFKLINQLPFFNELPFQALNVDFLKDLKSTIVGCHRRLHCDFLTSLFDKFLTALLHKLFCKTGVDCARSLCTNQNPAYCSFAL